MKHVKFIVPIYNSPVWVASDKHEAARLAAVKCGVFEDPETGFNMNGAVFYGNDANIIWLPSGVSFGTVAHEVAHCVLNIHHTRGIEIDTRNPEPFTYLTGYIMDKTCASLHKLGVYFG